MLRVSLKNDIEHREFVPIDGPLEFGRGPERGVPRWVVQDDYISRNQLRIQELPGARVRLENLSERVPVIVGETTVGPGMSDAVALPVHIKIGHSIIELAWEDLTRSAAKGSPEEFVGLSVESDTALRSLAELGDSPAPETLARWFEKFVSIGRAAANSDMFYSETARALVELIGLDCGFVFLRSDRKWQVAARFGPESERDQAFSGSVLRAIVKERRTLRQAGSAPSVSASLIDVSAMVASPIFGPDGSEIVGAVYGARFHGSKDSAVRISALEAQLVQVLAAAVGAGTARLESEKEVVRRQIQFEQFFSPELARELDRNPAMLDGRERETTLLFADIRGFSRFAERIEPSQTFALVQDVMERLTQRVREQSGVLVDYAGDGLFAMWNAPVDQPNHATLACRAALAMLAELPELNATWQASTGSPISLGIGVNTGPALVGNTGSRQRLKYGPLGHTVNVASRLEGVTKQFGVPVLISAATRQQINDSFATRRLSRIRVVGIDEPFDVYELHAEHADAEWLRQRDIYETALAQFEAGSWPEACHTIYSLLPLSDGHGDVPSLTLASRALDHLRSPPAHFDPILELKQK